jgi:exodeoxyribonuclease V alpha subunit
MTMDLGERLESGLDLFDARVALGAQGLLRDFNRAGVLAAADVHVARRLGRLGEEDDERVLLAAALAVRAVRLGAVCVRLAEAAATVVPDDGARLDDSELAWPAVDAWLDACTASPLVASRAHDDGSARPLRLVDGLLYLDRYWRDEELVRTELDARAARPSAIDSDGLRTALASVFAGAKDSERQLLAAAMTGAAVGDGAVRRPGHGENHHRGAAARDAARPPRRPAASRACCTHRQGRRADAGGRRRRSA